MLDILEKHFLFICVGALLLARKVCESHKRSCFVSRGTLNQNQPKTHPPSSKMVMKVPRCWRLSERFKLLSPLLAFAYHRQAAAGDGNALPYRGWKTGAQSISHVVSIEGGFVVLGRGRANSHVEIWTIDGVSWSDTPVCCTHCGCSNKKIPSKIKTKQAM